MSTSHLAPRTSHLAPRTSHLALLAGCVSIAFFACGDANLTEDGSAPPLPLLQPAGVVDDDPLPYARSDPRAKLPDEFLNWPADVDEPLVEAQTSAGFGLSSQTAAEQQPRVAEGWFSFDVMRQSESFHRGSERELSDAELHVPPGPPGAGGGPALGVSAERPGVGPQNVIPPDDDRIFVKNTTQMPYSAVVKLFVSWPNGISQPCSGSMVGPRTVLTAGHCVWNSAFGGWAARIMAVPGLAHDFMPYGAAMSVQLFSIDLYVNNTDRDHDMGALALDRPIGNQTQWFGRDVLYADPDLLNPVDVVGYPFDMPFNAADGRAGLYQYYSAGAAWNYGSLIVRHTADTAPGQSGSGLKWNYGNTIFAVHKAGSTSYNEAVAITSSRQGFINSWISTSNALPASTRYNYNAGWLWLGGYTHHPVTTAARLNGPDEVEHFIVDISGKVYNKQHSVSSNIWTPCRSCWWTEWPGVTAGDEIAASGRAGTQTTDVVVRDPLGQIYYANKIGGSRSGWTALGGTFARKPLVVSRWNNGGWEVHVFAVEENTAIVKYRYWSDATWSWSGWSAVPWTCAAQAIAVSMSGGDVQAFCSDYINYNVVTLKRTTAGTWSAPISLGTASSTGKVYLSPVSPPNGSRLDLFTVDTAPAAWPSGQWNLRHDACCATGGGWWGWANLNGRTQGRITAASRNGDLLNLFVRGDDGRTWSNYWVPGAGAWSGWGYAWHDDVLEAPTVAVHGGGLKVYLTARGPDHEVYEKFFNGSSWTN